MAQLDLPKSTPTIDPFVYSYLFDEVEKEFKSCKCSYADILFECIFNDVWKSFSGVLKNRGVSEKDQSHYMERMKVEMERVLFIKKGGDDKNIPHQINSIMLGGARRNEDHQKIMDSFNYSRADAINMLNGAHHHEMINKFATAAADDY